MASLLVAPPAGAENYAGLHENGPTGCDAVSIVYRADDGTHDYGFTGLTDAMEKATKWAANNAIDPTAVNAVFTSSPDDNTDVKVTDYAYTSLCGLDWYGPDDDPGIVGLATCRTSKANGRCKQSIVRYNTYFTSSTTLSNRRGLACHEMGHTLGLKHRESNGCIQQGYPKPQNKYSPHDRDHLSDDY